MKKYYSTQRPLDIATFPKVNGNNIIKIVNFDERTYVEEIGREAWGYIVYEKPIMYELAQRYELLDPTYEDKAKITRLLFSLLKNTRMGEDIRVMKYETNKNGEYVTVLYWDGYLKKVDVTADSGISLIRDVTRVIS